MSFADRKVSKAKKQIVICQDTVDKITDQNNINWTAIKFDKLELFP